MQDKLQPFGKQKVLQHSGPMTHDLQSPSGSDNDIVLSTNNKIRPRFTAVHVLIGFNC